MRKLRAQGPLRLVQDSVRLWQRQRAPLLSAALAYYMIFSLSPLLLLSVSIASIVFGREAAAGQLVDRIDDYLGEEAATIIQALLSTSEPQSTNVLTSLLSAAILLYGATLVFRKLKLVLNIMWDTVPRTAPGFSGVINRVKTYLFSLITALSIGLSLLFSLVLSTLLGALDERFLEQWPELASSLRWVELLFLWLLPVVLFAIIYKVLPDVTVAWRDVWLGAVATTILSSLGANLVGFYLRYSAVTSLQGAAGTVIVILLWLYFSVQFFLMGAAFTRVFADRYGSRIVPRMATLPTEE